MLGTIERFSVYSRRAVGVVLFLLPASAGMSDEPLEPRKDFAVDSPNGRCTAQAQLGPWRIVGLRREANRTVELWSIPEHRRFFMISDDCDSLVVIYDGGNLLNLEDNNPGTVVLTFYHAGQPGRRVRLGDIYSPSGGPMRTVSHWAWYTRIDWKEGLLVVETVDGRRIFFDPRSGQSL